MDLLLGKRDRGRAQGQSRDTNRLAPCSQRPDPLRSDLIDSPTDASSCSDPFPQTHVQPKFEKDLIGQILDLDDAAGAAR